MNLETMKILVKVAKGYQLYYEVTGNIEYKKKAYTIFKDIYVRAILLEASWFKVHVMNN